MWTWSSTCCTITTPARTQVWPLVRRRAPDLGSQLDMMEAEHASIAGAIVSTRTAMAVSGDQ